MPLMPYDASPPYFFACFHCMPPAAAFDFLRFALRFRCFRLPPLFLAFSTLMIFHLMRFAFVVACHDALRFMLDYRAMLMHAADAFAACFDLYFAFSFIYDAAIDIELPPDAACCFYAMLLRDVTRCFADA